MCVHDNDFRSHSGSNIPCSFKETIKGPRVLYRLMQPKSKFSAKSPMQPKPKLSAKSGPETSYYLDVTHGSTVASIVVPSDVYNAFAAAGVKLRADKYINSGRLEESLIPVPKEVEIQYYLHNRSAFEITQVLEREFPRLRVEGSKAVTGDAVASQPSQASQPEQSTTLMPSS